MAGLPDSVLVLGLGLSGRAVARYLLAGGVAVTAADESGGTALREEAEALRALGATVVLGAEAAPEGDFGMVVVSPGIPPHRPLLAGVIERGLPVVSEIEFAFSRARSPFVAVTGTNGKTTVTSLVHHLLSRAGIPAEIAGNIGTPLIEVVDGAGPETVIVAEVSSFQLAFTSTFRPRVSVLLNVTPDHLDWHGGFDRYAADKARVFAGQGPGDDAVIDIDDDGSAPYAEQVAARGVRVWRVSRERLPEGGAGIADGTLAVEGPEGPVALVRPDELRIRGHHNVSNALAAAAAAFALGADPGRLRDGLRTFEPIEHRLEPVAVVGGVEYVNDSKATNPDAVLKALTAFEDRGVVVLLGGRNKGNDFRELAEAVGRSARAAIAFGESMGEIADSFQGQEIGVFGVPKLADAVEASRSVAKEGDVVLLSPACASFDEFADYRERGRAFKAQVAQLARRAGDEA